MVAKFGRFIVTLIGGFMAIRDGKFSELEWQWIKVSLETQRKVLQRKRQAEVSGSEIDRLRAAEIVAIDVLLAKV